jgi:S1-C subfamily serine protease
MSTGRTYDARVVGTDAKDDVAVLQLVGASGLSTVTPDTDGVSVGDKVSAVGDANGTTGHLSAARGKVLALGRSITTQSEGTASGERLTGLMQFSSDVVSGDSGGATYDTDGQVVAMTTAASSGQDVDGYAIPIAKVTSIAGDLENGVSGTRYEYGRPAFLGIGLDGSTTQVQGVYRGTPAASAGLTAGDRITAVDGATVRTSRQLRSAIAEHSPGDAVKVTWTDASGSRLARGRCCTWIGLPTKPKSSRSRRSTNRR